MNNREKLLKMRDQSLLGGGIERIETQHPII